ncbi:MAG: hypothetical protein IKL24_04405 [Clostridia bacterium]|nr:hypothetical protein [Clostridia bacterium]
MPYISARTTVSITREKEENLKALFGKAIETIPGKTEAWLMCEFSDNCRLWFKGDNSLPSAYVEVKLLGKADSDSLERMTGVICDILEKELSIPADRTYVKYEECEHWGWNNMNF